MNVSREINPAPNAVREQSSRHRSNTKDLLHVDMKAAVEDGCVEDNPEENRELNRPVFQQNGVRSLTLLASLDQQEVTEDAEDDGKSGDDEAAVIRMPQKREKGVGGNT